MLIIRYNERNIDTPVMKEGRGSVLGEFIEKGTLILFLLSIPLSIRKVFTVFSPAPGTVFNEYTDISLYLSDIFLGVFLIILILRNKNSILSIAVWNRMFHVEHFFILIVPIPFIFWSGLSVLWSESTALAIYSFIKVIECYALYIGIALYFVPRGTCVQNEEQCSTWNNQDASSLVKDTMFHVEHEESEEGNVPRGTWNIRIQEIIKKCSTWNIWQITFASIILSGFIQGIIALFQFLLQSSIGLFFLNESLLSSTRSGIAKILLDGNMFIRPYGLFPHPNILGYFLGLTILFSLVYPLVFHRNMFHVEHYRWIYRAVLFVQITSFLLVFSKSAIIGLFLGLIYIFYQMFHVEHEESEEGNVPRGTWSIRIQEIIKVCSTWNISLKSSVWKKMFHVEHLLVLVIVIFVFLFIKAINMRYFLSQPWQERLFSLQETVIVAKSYFMGGTGIGQSVLTMQMFFAEKLELWQFQPIHNLYLLVFTEIGFVGFTAFLVFLVYLIRNLLQIVPRGTCVQNEEQCSTWNNQGSSSVVKNTMFHVEHEESEERNVPRGTFREKNQVVLLVSMAILTGAVSLTDHYLWDIQQGQLLFWFVLGLVASIQLGRKKSS